MTAVRLISVYPSVKLMKPKVTVYKNTSIFTQGCCKFSVSSGKQRQYGDNIRIGAYWSVLGPVGLGLALAI